MQKPGYLFFPFLYGLVQTTFSIIEIIFKGWVPIKKYVIEQRPSPSLSIVNHVCLSMSTSTWMLAGVASSNFKGNVFNRVSIIATTSTAGKQEFSKPLRSQKKRKGRTHLGPLHPHHHPLGTEDYHTKCFETAFPGTAACVVFPVSSAATASIPAAPAIVELTTKTKMSFPLICPSFLFCGFTNNIMPSHWSNFWFRRSTTQVYCKKNAK